MKTTVFCLQGDHPDDGGNKHVWNIGQLLPDYTALHPRRQSSSHIENVRSFTIYQFHIFTIASVSEYSAGDCPPMILCSLPCRVGAQGDLAPRPFLICCSSLPGFSSFPLRQPEPSADYQQRHLVAKQERLGEEMVAKFYLRSVSLILVGFVCRRQTLMLSESAYLKLSEPKAETNVRGVKTRTRPNVGPDSFRPLQNVPTSAALGACVYEDEGSGYEQVEVLYKFHTCSEESSFPFPFAPLRRRGCLVAPWFLWIILVPCACD
jgi:hypothetical protein